MAGTAIAAIKIALVAEAKAQKFYTQAAGKTAHPQAKEMFKQLADFEQGHYNRLKELIASLAKKKQYIDYEGKDFNFRIKSEVSGPIEENKEDALDILIRAIGAERDAQKHYTQLAQKTKDPAGKKMFERLAYEESLHYRLLSDEFYFLNNKSRWGD
jgi:rubrerythrin